MLAKDYPRAIREPYVGAVRKMHASDRHHQLLRLGEAALAYLASLAFADYRQARRADPDPAVERWVAGLSRLTTGEYLQAFRMTQKALGRPEIFGIKRYEVNAKLSEAARLAAATRALDYAQRIGATNIRAAIEEASSDAQRSVRWLGFWNDFVEYRNRVVHADDKGWPIDAEGYFELMAPLLEASLVEALRTEYIAHVLLEYPVARLVEVRRVGTDWLLTLDGEYRGAPLMADTLYDQPLEPWQTEVGASYVLGQHEQESWFVYARYYDLKRAGFPDALLDGRPESSAREPVSAPPEQPMTPLDQASPSRSMAPTAAPEPASRSTRTEEGQAVNRASTPHAEWTPRTPESAGPRSAPVSEVQPSEAAEHWFPSFSPWMLWGICSFGILAAVGFLRVATQTRDVNLRNWGVVYGALGVAVLTLAAIAGDSGPIRYWTQ